MQAETTAALEKLEGSEREATDCRMKLEEVERTVRHGELLGRTGGAHEVSVLWFACSRRIEAISGICSTYYHEAHFWTQRILDGGRFEQAAAGFMKEC